MSVRKTASAAKPVKKIASRPAATHPSWIDMIKECISANPDDARSGVSRPQIKKYVEDKYKLQIGNAQNTQLSKAIATGAEKGAFLLPKGPSGRVKLPPKHVKTDTSATKENKPASKTVAKPTAKAAVKPKAAKTASAKATTAKKPAAKPKATTATKAAPAKKPVHLKLLPQNLYPRKRKPLPHRKRLWQGRRLPP
ncbi:hypothetical protein SERLADRAFT_475551 [Serpula lacrymans var. lacrymans S7.9]|uniref:Histone H1 n=1 Tax=Serpula lacrymans var. lacrymans (strain S7.9) TaxID=578457 RepID=F8P6C4_SERL9|nr:uncharacterized protein SERLADRAFT_475551 [Serpula lacrymans var. lacrymans S7.9]EGO20991.1 hypothetical protein SERLADRAFT_475551 [Serpula lacrymans var. lacrymans S7.9]